MAAAASEPQAEASGGCGYQSVVDCLSGVRCAIVSMCLIFAAMFGISFYVIFLLPAPPMPEYSVAVAGIGGLDVGPNGTAQQIISPVLNVTVHIRNPDERFEACVCRHSGAAVSYGGVALGSGLVPPACSRPSAECEVAATVFGLDVAVPRALRDRLAAELPRREAEVDVTVTVATDCYRSHRVRPCGTELVVSCKAKIGGARSPCSVAEAREYRENGAFVRLNNPW